VSLPSARFPSERFLDILVCPACNAAAMALSGSTVRCRACGAVVDWTRGFGRYPCPSGALSDRYDAQAAGPAAERPRPDAWMDHVDRLLLEQAKGVCIEVGCGVGRFLAKLADRPGVDLVGGLDISPVSLEKAAGRLGGNLVLSPAEKLPFAQASVTALLSSYGSLAHVDFPRFLEEAARVLAPGGALAFWSFNAWAFTARGLLRGERHLLDTTLYPNRVGSAALLWARLRSSGFRDVTVRGCLAPAGVFRRLGVLPPFVPRPFLPLSGTDVVVTATRSGRTSSSR